MKPHRKRSPSPVMTGRTVLYDKALALFMTVVTIQYAFLFFYSEVVQSTAKLESLESDLTTTKLLAASMEQSLRQMQNHTTKQEEIMAVMQAELDRYSNDSSRIHNLEDKVQALQSELRQVRHDKQSPSSQLQARLNNNKPQPKTLYHLHIGKTGGTSLDAIGMELAKKVGYRYVGNRHFDWNGIGQSGSQGQDWDVVMMLRHPVSRAISHFYFAKTLSWTTGLKIRNQNFHEYLFDGDKQHLLDTRDVWQDGQAAVSWLTGTHIGSWAGCPKDQVQIREKRAQNTTAMMHLAAERLQSVKWFGLLEDLDRSMELLQYAFHLDYRPNMRQLNKHQTKAPPIVTAQDKEALALLMPQDLWLYDYAKLLFEARWQAYKQNKPISLPPYPPLPNITCISTRFELNCTAEPFKGNFRGQF